MSTLRSIVEGICHEIRNDMDLTKPVRYETIAMAREQCISFTTARDFIKDYGLSLLLGDDIAADISFTLILPSRTPPLFAPIR